MGWFKNHTKAAVGTPISASAYNELADTCDQISRIKCQPPLEVLWTPGGLLLRLAGPLFGVYIGIADGTITARSGATPGTGNVTLQTWNGTALASLGIDLPVRNWNATTGGIATGKYCVILKIAGAYWAISAEC